MTSTDRLPAPSSAFHALFTDRKPVIAMAHLPPLPGTPLYDGQRGVEGIVAAVGADVEAPARPRRRRDHVLQRGRPALLVAGRPRGDSDARAGGQRARAQRPDGAASTSCGTRSLRSPSPSPAAGAHPRGRHRGLRVGHGALEHRPRPAPTRAQAPGRRARGGADERHPRVRLAARSQDGRSGDALDGLLEVCPTRSSCPARWPESSPISTPCVKPRRRRRKNIRYCSTRVQSPPTSVTSCPSPTA